MFFSCAGQRPANLGVHNGRLAGCPTKPNCVSSQATDESHAIAPFVYQKEKEAAFGRLKKVIGSFKRTTIVAERHNYLHVEFRSAILIPVFCKVATRTPWLTASSFSNRTASEEKEAFGPVTGHLDLDPLVHTERVTVVICQNIVCFENHVTKPREQANQIYLSALNGFSPNRQGNSP